ncbi:MAG: 4-hydroxythreonine-4-phosphate dehydrogenase PdxA [Opitutales bacterium]|nr:4-hydroxythreonine-4-phosphate dehydrogenase PdxA [Opitutales bacterium]
MMNGRYLVIPGDLAGVGPELLPRCWEAGALSGERFAVAGPSDWLNSLPEAFRAEVQSFAVATVAGCPIPGEPDGRSARQAMDTLAWAAGQCREGTFRGLVTGPICKETMVREGFAFPGQTEFLANAWKGEPSMAFWGEELRVVLATWHIPLASVPSALTPEVLTRAVERAFRLAQKVSPEDPSVAVCGLNPHAGENGLLGVEEKEWIGPCLQELTKRVSGLDPVPQPADTLFWRARQGWPKVVVALYHDQGLAPLKTVEFNTSCQVTLGLPHARTSPDHGTAFGIAGQGKADPGSFRKALETIQCF